MKKPNVIVGHSEGHRPADRATPTEVSGGEQDHCVRALPGSVAFIPKRWEPWEAESEVRESQLGPESQWLAPLTAGFSWSWWQMGGWPDGGPDRSG